VPALRAPAAALLVAAAAALPYARTLPVPFQLDDYFSLVEDPTVHARSLSPSALAPAVAGFPLHRWLPRLTLAVNHALGGLEPAGYHLLNLALHLASALAALALAGEVLARTDPALDPSRRRRAALLAALLFAVHPLQTSAVTYVVQRMAVLAGLLALLSLHAWARARRSPGGEGPSARARAAWLAWAGAAAFLALSSKENAAALPLLVVAFEALVVGGLAARLRRHPLPAAAAALAAVAAVALAAARYPLERAADSPVPALALGERLLSQPRVLLHYLGRVAVPWPGWLHLEYGLAPSRGLLEPPATLAAMLALAALVAAAWWLRRRAPVVAFGVAFFLLALLVEQTVLPIDLAFEHRLYLPLFGLALAAGWGLERAAARVGPGRRWGPWPVALPLLLLLAAGAVARNEAWRDPVRLLGQDVAAWPGLPRPLLNLGAALFERGDLPGAEAALRRLVALDPSDARGWSNLAQLAVARGDPAAAIGLAERGVEADRDCFSCRQNLGAALLLAGQPERAVEALRGALLVRPEEPLAWAAYATALRAAGRPEEALAAARRAVALDPASPAARQALLQAMGR
jgi:protein O-mannosyl-transferase